MADIVEPLGCDPDSDVAIDALVKLVVQCSQDTEREAKPLVEFLAKLEKSDWQRRLDGEKTWERFCDEILGYDAQFYDDVRHGVEILGKDATVGEARQASVMERAQHAEPLAGHGAPIGNQNAAKEAAENAEPLAEHASTVDGNKVGVAKFVSKSSNNDATYLTRRIARDRPDILERMKLGEFTSVRQAALEAGIVKPSFQCPLDVDRAAGLIRKHFSEEDIGQLKGLL